MRQRFLIVFLALVLIFEAVIIFKTYVKEKPQKVEVEEVVVEVISKAPLVAIVLDDFGYTKENFDLLKTIGVPVTMAVLPDLSYSKEVCRFAQDNGMEVILHFPMEPAVDIGSMEKDTIMVDSDEATIKRILDSDLVSVESARGISNHMGSKATSDSRVMAIVFSELKSRDLFFLDSVTTPESVCEKVASEVGLPYARRDIFIDHDMDAEHIKKQMEKVEKVAVREGSAVAIGHDRKLTIEILTEIIPQMKERGIKFVKLSEMIETEGIK